MCCQEHRVDDSPAQLVRKATAVLNAVCRALASLLCQGLLREEGQGGHGDGDDIEAHAGRV